MDEMDDHLNEAGVHKRLRMPKSRLYSTGFSLGVTLLVTGLDTLMPWPRLSPGIRDRIKSGWRLRAEAQAMAEVLLPQRKGNGSLE